MYRTQPISRSWTSFYDLCVFKQESSCSSFQLLINLCVTDWFWANVFFSLLRNNSHRFGHLDIRVDLKEYFSRFELHHLLGKLSIRQCRKAFRNPWLKWHFFNTFIFFIIHLAITSATWLTYYFKFWRMSTLADLHMYS